MCVITGENGLLFGVFRDREIAEKAVEAYLEDDFYYVADKSTIIGKKWKESFYFNSNVVLDQACIK